VGRRYVGLPLKTKMSGFDTGALRYEFPEELLRYFDIVESGIRTDKPTGEDDLARMQPLGQAVQLRAQCLLVEEGSR
jgi:hypothetical protein